MRDINRIEPFLNKLQEVWELCPNLRFRQLINILDNIAEQKYYMDLFYLEDDKYLDVIEIFKINKLADIEYKKINK